jgi:methylated-DNA-[protein]-cysteine S-methyltransferase
MIYTHHASPVGALLLAGQDGETLSRLSFPGVGPAPSWRRDDSAFAAARQQLDEYFAGERHEFDLPLALEGSEWERRVWDALRGIPYGETRSYGEIATQVCTIRASRAVGRANGRNPVAIVVPCHRVIGADGRLTGFGGGLERKRALLDLEAGRAALPLSVERPALASPR